MKLFQKFFLLGSSLFVFFCFCLPWIEDESGFQLIVSDDVFLTPLVFMITLMITIVWTFFVFFIDIKQESGYPFRKYKPF